MRLDEVQVVCYSLNVYVYMFMYNKNKVSVNIYTIRAKTVFVNKKIYFRAILVNAITIVVYI
jgi:hypothetical protein